MDLLLLPKPDEQIRRAVLGALARVPAAIGPPHRAYASRWRLAGLAEGVASAVADDEDGVPGSYGCSPRSMRGVTRA